MQGHWLELIQVRISRSLKECCGERNRGKEQDLTGISRIKATVLGGRVPLRRGEEQVNRDLEGLLGRLGAFVNDGQEIICREV